MAYFLKKIFQLLGSVFTCLLLLSILINCWDEPIKPEVKTVLDWQPPLNAYNDNGYIFLFGMDAPLTDDTYTFGKKAVEAEVANYYAVKQSHKEPTINSENRPDPYPDWQSYRCDFRKQENCVDFYLQQNQSKLEAVLVSLKLLESRFNAVQSSKHYVEVMPPVITAQFPKYSHLVNASELVRIKAILNIARGRTETGIAQLVENAEFSRRLLRDSTSLISHLIAVNLVQKDTRSISELISKYPGLAVTYQAQLAPALATIAVPEYSMKNAFIYERNLQTHIMDNLKYNALEALSAEQGRLKNMATRLFFQPNATTNLFYEKGTLRLLLTEAGAQRLDETISQVEAKQTALMGIGFSPLYFINPVGKILAQISEPTYSSYVERQHDTDGYLTLVRLQLEITANKLSDDNQIKRLMPRYLDPYTHQSFDYDNTTRKITFEGKQPSNANFGAGNTYKISLH